MEEGEISLTIDNYETQLILELDKEILYGLRNLKGITQEGELNCSYVLKLNNQKQKFLIGLFNKTEKEECDNLHKELKEQFLNPEKSPIKICIIESRSSKKGTPFLKEPDQDFYDFEEKLNKYVDKIRELFSKYEKSNLTKNTKPKKEI